MEMRKMYADGSKLILIVENTEEMRAYIEKVFCPEIIGEPKAKNTSVTLNYDRYAGRTVTEVLKSEGEKAYANITTLIRYGIIAPEDRSCVEAELKNYLEGRFKVDDPQRYASDLSDEDVEMFFKYLESGIPESVQRMCCEKTGTTTFQTFLRETSVDVKRSALLLVLSQK